MTELDARTEDDRYAAKVRRGLALTREWDEPVSEWFGWSRLWR